MRTYGRRPFVLTIAGSDPSGGAGIQGDIKTISTVGGEAGAVITALTAQNSQGVESVNPVSPEILEAQLDVLLRDISPTAIKIGMLGTEENTRVVVAMLRKYGCGNVVLDPVLRSKNAALLLEDGAIKTLVHDLLPLVNLCTPNAHEAAQLLGLSIHTLQDAEEAVRRFAKLGCKAVLLKGGHLDGDESVDILCEGEVLTYFRSQRIDGPSVHGTGCLLSSAIATHLALGKKLEHAVIEAKTYVTSAIQQAVQYGHGNPSPDFFNV